MYKKILVFGLIFSIIDQVIKYIVVNTIDFAQNIKVINNFFYLTYIKNSGAAFGILQDSSILFVILSIIAMIGLIRYVIVDVNINKVEAISYSLIFGGIVGNFIDRILNGFVIDYLDFYIFGYNFPVFNFADMCLVIGFIIVIYSMFIPKGVIGENNNSRRTK